MLFGEGLFGLVAFALWVFCIFDVISSDASSVQNLPKLVWLLLVIFLGPLGSIAWLLLGRPRSVSARLGMPSIRSPRHPSGPIPEPPAPPPPDPDFALRREEALRRYEAEREEKLKEREAQLRRREQELRRREQGLEETPSD